jgi:hypothetical protein
MFNKGASYIFPIFDIVGSVFENSILFGCLGGAGRPIQTSRVSACIRN